ncbi:MAG TPA: Ldh family oxidoreductase, partial [Chryseosolibacter sp.]
MPQYYTFSAAHLRDFTIRVFAYFGVSPAEAAQAADVLSKADLRGIDSHGVARLRTYVDMFNIGRINPKPNIRIVRER